MSRLMVVDMDLSGNVLTSRFLLPNGRHADMVPLTFVRARICLVNLNDRGGYDDEW
jgi:hypothetical protein